MVLELGRMRNYISLNSIMGLSSINNIRRDDCRPEMTHDVQSITLSITYKVRTAVDQYVDVEATCVENLFLCRSNPS